MSPLSNAMARYFQNPGNSVAKPLFELTRAVLKEYSAQRRAELIPLPFVVKPMMPICGKASDNYPKRPGYRSKDFFLSKPQPDC